MVGTRFRFLIVKAFIGNNKYGHRMWSCLCDCGNETIVSTSTLNAGDKVSCGCFRKTHRIGTVPPNKGISKRYPKQHNDEVRQWCGRNPEKRRKQALKSTLKRKFNLSVEDYEQMVLRQNGKCIICEDLPKTSTDSRGRIKDRLAVDHCHKTGKIRGLLCHTCNTGLGQFKENLEILKKAVTYLEING